ncbi:uncharacterized protein K489DRAFT_227927 [Dissoconium aciculare CBS 342.82]|uniref:F-box domain-containing protein n=1 Tax=Dissoconium aciculare CBS 342.82 TaxID=1314786 RepID=A0A6J3M313_9PEZI|nr:uncharacterized protein K489DRAFT_227927 [Dissoconium aciculare CBS 342.82]KAF1821899.1 hypothetical protein K489DRAFT_227927 [Dissoconium aciculare CBS 342.82]
MLNVFRRRSGLRTGGNTASDEDLQFATHSKISFYDLPGEIRNQIYELSAHNATLRLIENHHKSDANKQKECIAIPGLLLTSHRCREEYLPLLLSTAYIDALIVNFDFKNVIRLTKGLYPPELKALRSNPSLNISLLVPSSSSQQEFSNLRLWATSCAYDLDRLPWNYQLAPESQSSTCSDIRRSCYYRMTFMFSAVEERLQWEMSRLINVIRDAEQGW